MQLKRPTKPKLNCCVFFSFSSARLFVFFHYFIVFTKIFTTNLTSRHFFRNDNHYFCIKYHFKWYFDCNGSKRRHGKTFKTIHNTESKSIILSVFLLVLCVMRYFSFFFTTYSTIHNIPHERESKRRKKSLPSKQ